MPDYSKTLIYKIVCNDLGVGGCYVGSTTDFTRRKHQHKKDCNNSKKNELKIYKIILENGGWDNWTMLEIEKFPCSSGNEARMREREVYEAMDSILNSIRPYSTVEEKQQTVIENGAAYYAKNIDKIKLYNIENRERIAKQCKEYRLENIDKCKKREGEYRIIKKQKQTAENKEKIKEYNAQYYLKRKLLKASG